MNIPPELDNLIPLFEKLYGIIQPIDVAGDGYCAVELRVSGFSEPTSKPKLSAYFGAGLRAEARTVGELTTAIAALDPNQARLERIRALKAELAELGEAISSGQGEVEASRSTPAETQSASSGAELHGAASVTALEEAAPEGRAA